MTSSYAAPFLAVSPRRACLLALTAAVVLIAGAPAEAYRGTSQQQAACQPDVFRLCSAYIPNVGPIVSCLSRNRAALSPACRAVFGGKVRKPRRR